MVFELESYRQMLEALPCGICKVMLDEDLTIAYANEFYYRLYGYTRQDAERAGFKAARFVLPDSDYRKIRKAVMDHVQQGDREFQLEYRGVHRSGKLMWLLVRCSFDLNRPESIVCAIVDIAERKQMEEDLRISMQENKIAYQLTDKLMYIYDVAERRLHQPQSAADEFGFPLVTENAPYSIAESGVIDEESREDYIAFYESILRGEPSGYAVIKKRRKDGTFGWYEGKYSSIYDRSRNVKKAVISCEDITEQREKELSYQKWSQYFQAQEGKTIGVYEYNLTKDLFDEEAGDTPPDYLRPLKKYTQTVDYIAQRFVHDDDVDKFYRFFDRDELLIRYYKGQTRGALDYRRRRADGSSHWARAVILLIADPYSDDVRLFMMNLDIDKEKREELKLRRLSEYDSMTGLLNRETFTTRVSNLLAEKNSAKRHALVMLDIDQFKSHNDLHGHPFGDQVIKETAQLIKGFLRSSDLCGRIGGDEFMVLLSNITSEADILPRIDILCNLLRRKSMNEDEISCSIGVAFYPKDGRTFQELYQKADYALYEVKKTERGNYKIYTPNVDTD